MMKMEGKTEPHTYYAFLYINIFDEVKLVTLSTARR